MATKVVPVNLMESLVESKLEELMQQEEMCCCEQCRMDVMALSLNNLPAKYTSSLSGDIFTRFHAMSTQFQADITAAVLKAIAAVRSNPRHPTGVI